MPQLNTIRDYFSKYAKDLEAAVSESFTPLQSVDDPIDPIVDSLKRTPFPAQKMAIMGVVKRWNKASSAAVIGEMGTGKSLISISAIATHAKGKRYNALTVVPPLIVKKWCREVLQTLSGVRVFIIDRFAEDRKKSSSKSPKGVNEVVLENGEIVRKGLSLSLSELAAIGTGEKAAQKWAKICPEPAIFILGRDRAKLGYQVKPAFLTNQKSEVINPDTGLPVKITVKKVERPLLASDFGDLPRFEILGSKDPKRKDPNDPEKALDPVIAKSRRRFYSPLWQADRNGVRRIAPIDFIQKYLDKFFDYGIADEAHQMKGETAQGNILGAIASTCKKTLILTGTISGGYAEDLFNILFRLDPKTMVSHGFTWDEKGMKEFQNAYGCGERISRSSLVLKTASGSPKKSRSYRRKPGASPLLFGKHLMGMGAFISLEDLAANLPEYHEEIIPVQMTSELAQAYKQIEEDCRKALSKSGMNRSILSKAVSALLAYCDHPYGFGTIMGTKYDAKTKQATKVEISTPPDLSRRKIQPKEQRLIDEVRKELAEGRRSIVYAIYNETYPVLDRLHTLMLDAGIKASMLKTDTVSAEEREGWYRQQMAVGAEVILCHPALVQTGLDLLDTPTLIYYESGTSTFVLRQSSRRSWRIGQTRPVRVKHLFYEGTLQEQSLRLMARKMLVSLMLEGKFADEGLTTMEEGDVLTAMAKELVTKQHVGDKAKEVWSKLRDEQLKLLAAARKAWPVKVASPVVPSVPAVKLPLETLAKRTATRQAGMDMPPLFALFDQCAPIQLTLFA
jgi:hypothetical protein